MRLAFDVDSAASISCRSFFFIQDVVREKEREEEKALFILALWDDLLSSAYVENTNKAYNRGLKQKG